MSQQTMSNLGYEFTVDLGFHDAEQRTRDLLRGLDLRTPIARSDLVIAMPSRVVCRDVLGGLLREYSAEPLSASA